METGWLGEVTDKVSDAAAQLGVQEPRLQRRFRDPQDRTRWVMHQLLDAFILLAEDHPDRALEALDFYGPLFGRAMPRELRKRVKARKVGQRP